MSGGQSSQYVADGECHRSCRHLEQVAAQVGGEVGKVLAAAIMLGEGDERQLLRSDRPGAAEQVERDAARRSGAIGEWSDCQCDPVGPDVAGEGLICLVEPVMAIDVPIPVAAEQVQLAIEGGRNRVSGMNVQGVGAANREQIEKVFYRAFTQLMPASATYSTARAVTIQSARDLYGSGNAVETAVIQAWNAVGVN